MRRDSFPGSAVRLRRASSVNSPKILSPVSLRWRSCWSITAEHRYWSISNPTMVLPPQVLVLMANVAVISAVGPGVQHGFLHSPQVAINHRLYSVWHWRQVSAAGHGIFAGMKPTAFPQVGVAFWGACGIVASALQRSSRSGHRAPRQPWSCNEACVPEVSATGCGPERRWRADYDQHLGLRLGGRGRARMRGTLAVVEHSTTAQPCGLQVRS